MRGRFNALAGNYEVISDPGAVFLITRRWKKPLLQDLREDFASVKERQPVGGRGPSFMYTPRRAEGTVVVRFVRHGGLFAFLGERFISAGRVSREMEAVMLARAAKVNVPEIVAVALRRGFLTTRIRVVSEAVQGARTLLDALQSDRVGLARAVAREVKALHDAGIFHQDLNLKNILVADGKAHIIDLDKARIDVPNHPTLSLANLARLNRSCEKWAAGAVRVREKIRFLKEYNDDKISIRNALRNAGRGLWLHRLWWRIS